MGLDMYLTARTFLWGVRKTSFKAIKKGVGKDLPKMKKFRLRYIEFEVGYFRKVNQIHSWFVRNIQDGNDDCKTYYVQQSSLTILLNTINQVLENHKKAEKLLPTQSGFFFGTTDYDEGYFLDLIEAKKIIERILKDVDFEKFDIYYHSSW